MRNIPWEKVLTAIKLRDAAGLRLLAEEARCDQRRELLQVFAGIVANSTPIAEDNRESLPRIGAHPVRDRLQQPFPTEGARGQQLTCRTALYRTDGYSIELRIEHERGSRRIDLIGQIARRKRPRSRLAETAVLLLSGTDVVAQTLSDALGEFHMQCAPTRSLRLCVPLEPPGKGIEVPLGALISRFLLDCGKIKSGSPAARAS
ncbi:MAG TPA: hypothetical protein VES66_06670 [Terriglobales bacterium]|nr:hypothetical protein [Terriglobales bacterium]